jgi:hypothetical protein
MCESLSLHLSGHLRAMSMAEKDNLKIGTAAAAAFRKLYLLFKLQKDCVDDDRL